MSGKLKVVEYTPASEVGNMNILIRKIADELKQAHHLGLRLAKRNIRSLYRRSALGYFWTIIPPLFTSLIWIFLNGQQVVNIEIPGDVPYPLFVLISTLLWQTFSESVITPLKNTESSKAMLTKINFPREALLLSGVYEVIFNTLIKVALIILVLLIFRFFPPLTALLSLLGITALIILGTSIGLMLTPIGMLYSDVSRGIVIVMQFAIYLTPVIYPEPRVGSASVLIKANPVTPLLTTTRGLLLDMPLTSVPLAVIYTLIALLVLVGGIVLFRLSMPIIIERIGS